MFQMPDSSPVFPIKFVWKSQVPFKWGLWEVLGLNPNGGPKTKTKTKLKKKGKKSKEEKYLPVKRKLKYLS